MEVKVIHLTGHVASDESVLKPLAFEGWEMRGLFAFMGTPTAYLYRAKILETAPQPAGHKKEEVHHGKQTKENRR